MVPGRIPEGRGLIAIRPKTDKSRSMIQEANLKTLSEMNQAVCPTVIHGVIPGVSPMAIPGAITGVSLETKTAKTLAIKRDVISVQRPDKMPNRRLNM
jgi:hypothetical protein